MGFKVTHDDFGWEQARFLIFSTRQHGFAHPGRIFTFSLSDISVGSKETLNFLLATAGSKRA